MSFKLSDSAIAQIVQLFQMGILTGTDVSDQLRTMTLSQSHDTNVLEPSPEFVEVFNENIQRMLEQADSMANETTDTE